MATFSKEYDKMLQRLKCGEPAEDIFADTQRRLVVATDQRVRSMAGATPQERRAFLLQQVDWAAGCAMWAEKMLADNSVPKLQPLYQKHSEWVRSHMNWAQKELDKLAPARELDGLSRRLTMIECDMKIRRAWSRLDNITNARVN